jgi:predicted  nucleic acid-binding Zn-ribbon protein|tara:strand:- start:5349 stop:5684 length:336 start_codon:yes stop_codon:yes gene_type:complete
MEFGARELLTFGTVLAGLAGTWAVIKSTVARIQEDLKGVLKEIASLNTRLDATESGDAVMKHQVSVLGSMLSPDHQETKAREVEALNHRVTALRRDTDTLMHTHNGSHPPV